MKKKGIVVFLLAISGASAFYFFNPFVEIKEGNSLNANVIETIDSISVEKTKTQLFFLYPKFTNSQVVEHSFYTLSYSKEDEQAEWVAYTLYKNSVNDSTKRKDNFREDPKVIDGSASLSDYRGSGYDRGHLAPAKAMSFNNLSMSESFFMSNMSPQHPSFNRGIWKKLEEEVRDWIAISDSLYVVTGPILDKPIGKIGENEVTVPSAYYKTIIRFKENELFGIGFLMNNEKSNKTVHSFAVSIDSIEQLTKLDFYSNLQVSKQNKVEINSDINEFLKN